MAEYKYDAFADARSEIRILTIHPGKEDDPLYVELHTHNLAALPTYEALSYTWGDDTTENKISINGKSAVTFGNAYEGLLELRSSTLSRAVWIDAICINQRDLQEKQQQILLKKDVYQMAMRVVVWLPRPRCNEDLAVGLLYELRAQLAEEANTVQIMQQIHKERLRSPDWIALRDFLDHPWWSRIWTLQEVVVGREIVIQCGRHIIPWDHINILGYDSRLYGMFYKLIGEGLYSNNNQTYGCAAISTIDWMRGNLAAGREFSLLNLLPQCWWRKSTDTRDCIFGLFALAADIEELDLYPDYIASVEEVLMNTVRKLLLEYGTLELFGKAGLGYERKLPGLPSYVPDWTNIPDAPPLSWLFYDGSQDIQPEKRGLSLRPDGSLLLNFFCLDSIAHVSEPLIAAGSNGNYSRLVPWFDAVEKMAITGAQDPYPMMAPPHASVSLFEAFWRTMIANSSGNSCQAPEDWFHGYLGYKFGLSRYYGIEPTCLFENMRKYEYQYNNGMDHTREVITNWYNMMLITSCERAFCTTCNGLMGLVPPGTLPGDIICLLPGGTVPFVMRLGDPSKNEIQLVGESYIHGVTAIDALVQFRSQGKDPRSMILV